VNGLLIPGGSAILKPGHHWFDTAKQLLDLAMAANDRGDYFPVLAICLGFETVSIAVSGNTSLLTKSARPPASPTRACETGRDGLVPRRAL
jgi:gamma-glutamyl hydrolase